MYRFLAICYFIVVSFNYTIGQKVNLDVPDYFGERISYSLKVGFLQVGEVDINFEAATNNCDAYIVCNAYSTGLVSFLKDIHYKFDACLDTSNGHALKSSRTIKEGSYNDYDEVFYDRITRPDSTIVTTESNDTVIIPNHVYDILVAFYQFRKNYIHSGLEEGDMINIETFFVDSEWDLDIKYVGKEKVNTNLGTAKCYKFMPRTEVGKFFKTEEDMVMWVTANKYLIPVKIQVKLKVGTLTADIISYKRADR
jgi:hypothetical protein